MSEILTRQAAAQHVEWLTHEASNQEWADLPQTIASFEADINTTIDALDAALEALRFYAKAESWKVWTDSTNGMCTARVDGGHEARKVLMDLLALVAARTPDAAVGEGE